MVMIRQVRSCSAFFLTQMSNYASGTMGSRFASSIVPPSRSWDFSGSSDRPVQLFLHTVEHDEPPVRAVMRVSSRPSSRVSAASIVLPCDPSRDDVDFSIDCKRDLSFPAKSFIGRGGYGQVGYHTLLMCLSMGFMTVAIFSFAC